MSQPECGNCARPTADGAAICARCAAALSEALRRVPALLDDLLVALSRQDRLTSGGGKRGKLAEAPLPVRFDVSGIIAVLGNELTTWARDLVDRHGFYVPRPPRRSPRNGPHGVVFPASSPVVDLACYAADWLADNVGHLRTHPAALEAYNGLTDAISAAEMAIDRPEGRLFIGSCEECQASLYARPDAATTRCERCHVAVPDVAQRWDSALLKLRGYPATAALIAGSIGELYGEVVSRKLINSWHHRGTLAKVDDDPDTGDPRFRIGEVLDRAAKSKSRKAG